MNDGFRTCDHSSTKYIQGYVYGDIIRKQKKKFHTKVAEAKGSVLR